VQDLIHHPAFGMTLFNLLIIWPLWRIFRRTGLDARLSLLLFVPLLGSLLVLMVLGHRAWPALPPRPARRAPKARRTL